MVSILFTLLFFFAAVGLGHLLDQLLQRASGGQR